MNDHSWYCPAIEKEIGCGLCWEYSFATIGGPADTAYELNEWIKLSKRVIDIEDFHRVCKTCIHCQWANELP